MLARTLLRIAFGTVTLNAAVAPTAPTLEAPGAPKPVAVKQKETATVGF